jgi:cold shock CspA family protein
VFVHWKDVEADGHGDLAAGDQVEFEYSSSGDRGPKAVAVRLIEPASAV